MLDQYKPGLPVIASYILAGGALLLVLEQGLLAALFSGLLVYSLVHVLAPMLGKRFSGRRAKMIAVALLGVLIVVALSAAVWGTVSFFQSDAGRLPVLLQKMADVIEASRHQIPEWLRQHLPNSAEALREMMATWLREHAVEAKTIGERTGRTIAHILIGMIIGAMAALHQTTSDHRYLPLAAALHDRVANLHYAFQRIVFAQVRIAGLNTIFTAIFLFVALPLSGIRLPLSKSMVVITFIAGLLPVAGNLISNTVIVIIGLSHSLHTAIAALIFLVAIHKLEYFLNAKIIGSHINARAWELLAAMLVLESIFGISGVVAAPVLYAYIKKELSDCVLI
ncbi:MAG: family transporter [Herminiimonas sp.]|nr:family transporter [Herminiimonas sp.]